MEKRINQLEKRLAKLEGGSKRTPARKTKTASSKKS
jgi:hypothetical protein